MGRHRAAAGEQPAPDAKDTVQLIWEESADFERGFFSVCSNKLQYIIKDENLT